MGAIYVAPVLIGLCASEFAECAIFVAGPYCFLVNVSVTLGFTFWHPSFTFKI
jgi:hypothetical protein